MFLRTQKNILLGQRHHYIIFILNFLIILNPPYQFDPRIQFPKPKKYRGI